MRSASSSARSSSSSSRKSKPLTTELLAPAGGQEALVAAVQSGADAVYMGFGAFNARRSARNFSDEEFRAAVSYCHLRGVKVYLTLNTLVTDRELPLLGEEARIASECGVDAILVQDWGVLAALREIIPDVPLHASTQMSLHTLSGVAEAARLGMTRAVLARELNREEIAEICEKSPIEIEAFVHGALCMCYSGQCEMSAVIGRRSGNRGACAQPCRLPYGFSGKADAHPLSLKDANLAPFVPEMQDMGVACLKIEGRMKRPEYVAAVTEIYAHLLREHRTPTKDEQKKLALAFSRDGFTEGYYRGARGREMFGTRPENARWPEDWFSEIRARYEKENLRLVPLTLECTIRAGEAMRLRAEDAVGHTVTVTGAVPEAARNRAITVEEVEARLKKTGGTAFSVASCFVTLDDGLAVLLPVHHDVLHPSPQGDLDGQGVPAIGLHQIGHRAMDALQAALCAAHELDRLGEALVLLLHLRQQTDTVLLGVHLPGQLLLEVLGALRLLAAAVHSQAVTLNDILRRLGLLPGIVQRPAIGLCVLFALLQLTLCLRQLLPHRNPPLSGLVQARLQGGQRGAPVCGLGHSNGLLRPQGLGLVRRALCAVSQRLRPREQLTQRRLQYRRVAVDVRDTRQLSVDLSL